MKVRFAYFSGTGNTMRVAETVRSEMEKRAVPTDSFVVSDGVETMDDDFNVLVLSYPVYGFNPPANFLSFVKNIPDGNSRPFYILKSSGEPLKLNNSSSLRIIKILVKKGYVFKKEYHVVMPYNMIFRHSDGMASRLLNVLKIRAPFIADEIVSLEESPLRASLMARLTSVVCRVQFPFYRVNTRLLFKVDTDKCVRCMACVKNCPRSNIEFRDGKFVFGNNCVGCVRCSFSCPVDAFKIGLLEPMHVNGRYNFDADFSSDTVCAFCKNDYEKYFSLYEKQ